MMLADAIEQIGWMTAALSEQCARVEFLERRLAETTSDGLRYRLTGGRHGYVELVCTDEDCGGIVVASWPDGTRCLPVDAARARHDREKHREAPPRIPSRDLIEAIGVLEGCVAITTTFPIPNATIGAVDA